ncbi:hypothetical protein NL676_035879 [Syzygium grande]|nr:hypothetical protein NL676_035879 [Syzygium grande]
MTRLIVTATESLVNDPSRASLGTSNPTRLHQPRHQPLVQAPPGKQDQQPALPECLYDQAPPAVHHEPANRRVGQDVELRSPTHPDEASTRHQTFEPGRDNARAGLSAYHPDEGQT